MRAKQVIRVACPLSIIAVTVTGTRELLPPRHLHPSLLHLRPIFNTPSLASSCYCDSQYPTKPADPSADPPNHPEKSAHETLRLESEVCYPSTTLRHLKDFGACCEEFKLVSDSLRLGRMPLGVGLSPLTSFDCSIESIVSRKRCLIPSFLHRSLIHSLPDLSTVPF